MLLVLGVGYFLLVRPMNKQRKQQEQMRSALKPGDRVLTSAGIYGTVVKLRDDRIQVRIANGVQVDMTRNSVASVVGEGAPAD